MCGKIPQLIVYSHTELQNKGQLLRFCYYLFLKED